MADPWQSESAGPRVSGRRGRRRAFAAAAAASFAAIAYIYYLVPFESRRVTPGKDTTFLLGPVNLDGTVDYVAARNRKFGRGVTAENNAAVLILRAVGPGGFDVLPAPGGMADNAGCRRSYMAVLEQLGLAGPASEDDYFVDSETYQCPPTAEDTAFVDALRQGRPVVALPPDNVLDIPARVAELWWPPRAPWRAGDKRAVADHRPLPRRDDRSARGIGGSSL